MFIIFLSFFGCSILQRTDKEKVVSTFAVIGDYGSNDSNELAVVNLVKNWNPDFIITVGDNNYDKGSQETIDDNIGKYYHDFIGNYMGHFGAGSDEPRFFPSLGNHDWETPGAKPYLDYFTLPGNERYYDFVKGPVHFFVIDSDGREPDGTTSNSVQAKWLENKLLNSTSNFNIVYFHHPPYTSSERGPIKNMRWPFKAWKTDLVLTGHDHYYEKLNVKGLPYLIVGSGGKSLNMIDNSVPESQFHYDRGFGAVLVKVKPYSMKFKFYSVSNPNKPIDTFLIKSN